MPIPLDVFNSECDLIWLKLADQLRSREALAFAGELFKDVLFLVEISHVADDFGLSDLRAGVVHTEEPARVILELTV